MYDTMDPSLNHSYPRPVDVNVSRPRHEDQGHRDIISVSPAFDYIRRTFWDNLLDTYSATREQS